MHVNYAHIYLCHECVSLCLTTKDQGPHCVINYRGFCEYLIVILSTFFGVELYIGDHFVRTSAKALLMKNGAKLLFSVCPTDSCGKVCDLTNRNNATDYQSDVALELI